MGREPNNLDDERTWQQPLGTPGGGRPHDQPTVPEQAPEGHEAATAPEVTNPERTSLSGEVSRVSEGSTGEGSSGSDPRRTQSLPRDGSSDWDMLPPPIFEEGQVVFDKYRLLEKIGEGGMGEVWRVWHVTLETERALKLIKPELAHNDKGWRRFQREARLMAKINHPNAVAVYDFRRTRSVAYIEMEFIRGRSLSEIIKDRRDQPMPLHWTAQILDQLCAVLQEAHGHVDETTGQPKPIIHRDLKPSNLMLVERKDDTGPPRLKVLDFGIAKIVEDDGATELTGAGDLVGTPAYMSPEQIRGGFEKDEKHQEIDGRSDLYSTGVVLYHLLTGTIPFRGSKMALLAAQLNTAPMPMKEANPNVEVPPEVQRVVMQCLEKDPANRPPTAVALAEAFLRAAGVSAVGIGSGNYSSFAVPRIPAKRLRISPPKVVAGVLVAAVLIAGTAVIAFPALRGGGPSSTVKTTDGEHGPGGGTPGTPLAPKESKKVSDLWEPEGYAAVEPEQRVPDRHYLPLQLKRKNDEARFYHLGEGLYLPDGYTPESANDVVGAAHWPRAIIRQKDKVRFICILGATYKQGDPNEDKPALDDRRNSLKPHPVRVSDFYIQEIEVTNGEIERYRGEHNEEEKNLEAWAEWYKGFQEILHIDREKPLDREKARKFPAACVGYLAARNYARSVTGLLPTEAQWEWAAKSRNESFWFPWGAEFTPEGQPPRAKLYEDAATYFGPVAARTYPDDKTAQGVYDMAGNLREMCADVYKSYSSLDLTRSPLVDHRPTDDPTADGVKIVVRGGSFRVVDERKARSFWRSVVAFNDIPDDVGFRIVIECPPKADESP